MKRNWFFQKPGELPGRRTKFHQRRGVDGDDFDDDEKSVIDLDDCGIKGGEK